ncbi:Uncharacterized protein FWK35_00006032 [Aphis craccivora]|uniref:Integrase catalytic domain-containing protein n=1 Tax=Aphis craccivora TaxID=307492 RepID=A0A6G0Z5M9_APHCR|nr:Uncharacterized protein FWK35_00006032 [Aphis craccivora]
MIWIMSDITNLVLACVICNKYNRSNKKTDLLSHEIPDIPFDKIGADIAHERRKDYLVIVDYFSRWVEVTKLKWKTAQELIKKCKKIFARLGIPSVLIVDNMPFNSHKFKLFAKEWGIEIINTSPNYPVSNGLAEKYVGIIKKMIKKCSETNNDIEDYLLNYRNTPLVNMGLSPANLLQSRILRTKLPIKDIQNKKISININKKMKENQLNQKKYFDKKGTIKEVAFEEKEKIWLQDKLNKTWSEATVIKKLKWPRCYLVRDSRGRELRRNIIFMRKRKTVSLEFEEEEVKGDEDVISKKVRTSERTKKKPDRLVYYE